MTLRLGYAYRPSIMANLPDVGNYLDPPKHMLTAGLGWKFRSLLGFAIPTQLDIHGAYHVLVTQLIVKSLNDEFGYAGYKIGFPSYSAGGAVFGGGVSVTLAL